MGNLEEVKADGATSAQWQQLQAALDHAAKVVFADPRVDGPLYRAEATRYLMRLAQFAREAHVEDHDPAYPMLIKLESPFMQWGLPNPDYLYTYAPVHGDYTYRFYGNRGTCRMFTAETWSGDWFHVGDQKILDCIENVADGSGDMEVGADGEFEIILSRTKPRSGNWLPIGEGLGTVLIRECYYDWNSEKPAKLYIEREGATFPAPPVTAAKLEDHIWHMCEFLRDATIRMQRGVDLHYGASPDTLVFPGLDVALGTDTGFPKQFYGRGHYRIGPEEAVIIEVTPPDCAFWSFQLGSPFWEAGDWHLRGMSINASQAVLDSDGVLRIVIAHRDPGVPNWLDTGAHPHGTITCRWNRLKTEKKPPIPKIRNVAFASIRSELPAETGSVTPQQRSERLRRHMLSVRRRRAD